VSRFQPERPGDFDDYGRQQGQPRHDGPEVARLGECVEQAVDLSEGVVAIGAIRRAPLRAPRTKPR